MFIVTTLKDGGAGSLRAAIDLANTAVGADAIVFAAGLKGVVQLGSDLPAITDDLTISGPGSNKLAIDGMNRHRPFTIEFDASDVEISGLKLTRGSADRGGAMLINSGGDVLIKDCVISGNTATGTRDDVSGYTFPARGGAIDIQAGSVTIDGCTISRNKALGNAGRDAFGGAIAISNDGGEPVLPSLTISSSTISGNRALGANGAKGIPATPADEYGYGGSDAIDAIIGGSASGGGVFAGEGTVVTISNSTVSGNVAKSGNGGAGANGIRGAKGERGAPGEEGGEGSVGGDATSGAVGGDARGGGIFSNGTLTIQNSTISGNVALAGKGGKGGHGGKGGNGGAGGPGYSYGGYRYPGGYGGSGGDGGAGGVGGDGGFARGGGVYCVPPESAYATFPSASLTIQNSTISGNTAQHGKAGAGGTGGAGGAKGPGRAPTPYDGGGDYDYALSDRGYGYGPSRGARGERGLNGMLGDGSGGGVFAGDEIDISQSTIANNTASLRGGGLAVWPIATATIANATIAGNKATGLVVRTVVEDEYGGRQVEIVTLGEGGGIYVFTEDVAAEGSISVISSIIADNRARLATHSDLFQVIDAIDAMDSLIENRGGAAIDTVLNITGVDPKLGKLKLSGGSTATMLPGAGSRAIDGGANPDNLETDQRGAARVQGTSIDIGAVETG